MSISDNLLTEKLFGGNFDLTTDNFNNNSSNSDSFFNKNSIIYIIIFILFVFIFYFIINKFGYSNYNLENTSQESSLKSLQDNISQLQTQLYTIKSEMSQSTSNSSNSSNSDPIINFNTSPDLLNNLGGSCGSGSCPKPPPIIFDPIANYDQAKLFDPLVDPRGRTSADQIPAPQVAAQFNFPTQGVLDRYHRVGLLIALDEAPDSAPRKHRGKKSKRITKKGRYPDSSDNLSDNSTGSTSSTSSTGSTNSTGSYRGVQIAPVRAEKGIGGIEGFGIYADEGPNGILELIGKKINDNWYQYFTSISKGNKVIKIVVNNRNRKELYSGDVVYLPELNRWYQVQMDEMDMIEYNPYVF